MRPPLHIEELMAEHICGIISASDLSVLQDALEQNPQYQDYYQELKKRMLKLGDLPDDPGMASRIVARASRNRTLRMVVPIAALLIIGLLMVFYQINSTGSGTLGRNSAVTVTVNNEEQLDLRRRSGSVDGTRYHFSDSIFTINDDGAVKLISIDVPFGKTFQLMLPDSSMVHLNAGSALRYRLPFSSRDVELQGEAYFMIRGSPLAPFTVKAAATEIKVLGTTFNVNVYDDARPCITLVEGKVAVRYGMDSIYLSAARSAIRINGKLKIIPSDFGQELAWIKKMYYWDDKPLDSVAMELTRIYGRKFIVEDGDTDRISGSITENMWQSLQQLASSGLISYRTGPDSTIYLKSAEPRR